MHATGTVTDSMRMYQWGVEGGRPAAGHAGSLAGVVLQGHGRQSARAQRTARRSAVRRGRRRGAGDRGHLYHRCGGHAAAHRHGRGQRVLRPRFEKKNYLYLASSKLRNCALGPELAIDPDFSLVRGEVAIERSGETIWRKAIQSGESAMCHSLANMEHHHFKFEAHRRPGDLHVHFFGADAFSFGEGIRLADGDVMQVRWDGFGRPLRNTVRVVTGKDELVAVRAV